MSRYLIRQMRNTIFILILAITFTGCANASPIPETTSISKSTLSPSNTPTSTNAFKPSETPTLNQMVILPSTTPTNKPTFTQTVEPTPTKELSIEELADQLGYEDCKGCYFQDTPAGRLLIGEGGVRGIPNDDGSFRSTKGWENLTNPIEIQTLSSGDLIVVNSFVGGVTENQFPLVNGRGERVGTNKFGYWLFYIKDGKKYAELVPVAVTDLQGNTIVMASGYYGLKDFDNDPENFIRLRITIGKRINPVYLQNVKQLEKCMKIDNGLVADRMENLLFKWLDGSSNTSAVFSDGSSGGVLPLWSFDNWLMRNKKVNIG